MTMDNYELREKVLRELHDGFRSFWCSTRCQLMEVSYDQAFKIIGIKYSWDKKLVEEMRVLLSQIVRNLEFDLEIMHWGDPIRNYDEKEILESIGKVGSYKEFIEGLERVLREGLINDFNEGWDLEEQLMAVAKEYLTNYSRRLDYKVKKIFEETGKLEDISRIVNSFEKVLEENYKRFISKQLKVDSPYFIYEGNGQKEC
ncbi:hypothetical protein [Solibacillus sp. FSL K6-4121]|uniref:hypothetical protein n=1 Tax=Solibacillus sp. FSL K6-4121 TaxID=2921505 RepID=UPI0030FC78EC